MRRSLIIYPLWLLLLLAGCSDDNGTGVSADLVVDPFPLALGNRWEYALQQSIYVHEDTTKPVYSASSSGLQVVTVNRTEMIGGDEAYGLTIYHQMDYLFSIGADTVIETHYYSPRQDRVLLKAEQGVYNPTGGFIPFSAGQGEQGRLGTRILVNGRERFISLERLALLLLGSGVWHEPENGWSGPALANDGIQNQDNVAYYPEDFIFVFRELFKGRNWISQAAQEVGGLDIRQRVTNILPSLGAFEGPIAEVERQNAFIQATSSENYKLRYYFKGGVGLVQVEISDPEFLIIIQLPDGSINFLGTGTWTFIKTLQNYEIK